MKRKNAVKLMDKIFLALEDCDDNDTRTPHLVALGVELMQGYGAMKYKVTKARVETIHNAVIHTEKVS